MTPIARNRAVGAVVAFVLFGLEQLVKWGVTGPLGIWRLGDVMELLPVFALRYTENNGVSLGMLSATSDAMRWGLVALTGGIALVVTIWMMREKRMSDILPLALILGGALGNIRDRVQFGFVIDYADLHFGEWRPFYIFNLADAAISIGVVLLLARALLVRDKTDETGDPTPAETIR